MSTPEFPEQIAADIAWLTRLARGSSWPGEMAQRVEDAATRVEAFMATGTVVRSPAEQAAVDAWNDLRERTARARQMLEAEAAHNAKRPRDARRLLAKAAGVALIEDFFRGYAVGGQG